MSVVRRMKKGMCWKMIDGVQEALLTEPCQALRKRVGPRKRRHRPGVGMSSLSSRDRRRTGVGGYRRYCSIREGWLPRWKMGVTGSRRPGL